MFMYYNVDGDNSLEVLSYITTMTLCVSCYCLHNIKHCIHTYILTHYETAFTNNKSLRLFSFQRNGEPNHITTARIFIHRELPAIEYCNCNAEGRKQSSVHSY